MIAGNLFDCAGPTPRGRRPSAAWPPAPRFREALRRFLGSDRPSADPPDRRPRTGVRHPPGDGGAMAAIGVSSSGGRPPPTHHHRPAPGAGGPGEHAYAPGRRGRTGPRAGGRCQAGGGGDRPGRRTVAHARRAVPGGAPWLEGLDRLSDPSALSRFVTSRVLYRRFGRYAWWLLCRSRWPPSSGSWSPLGARTTSATGCRPAPSGTPTRPTGATSCWWPAW